MTTLGSRFDDLLAWLTSAQHHLRSFALLRILLGVAILMTLVPSARDRGLLWGDASFWVDPEARRRGFVTFDLLMPKDSPLLFDVAFFGLVLLAVLFTIGLRTRIVLPVMLVLLVSLQANNPYVLNGGDTLIRLALLFMLFANLDAHLSVDARLRRGRARRRRVPAHVANAAHNVGLVLCWFQILVVYVVSGFWKLSGGEWLDGTALFYALRLDAFAVQPIANELLWQSSVAIGLATFVALWAQTLFPLAVLWRPTRIAVLVTLVLMHLGVATLMGLWPFSLAMIGLDLLFVRDSTWVGLRARARRLRDGVRRPAENPTRPRAAAPVR
ncbi:MULTISPECIES: HTTM domain-containing protein [unclassified Aeromicrobium]|uniref:HTTM domain-containing protein n=1 Tax=unclassified Aeromicrobium TaxID=2633570 RepID=UPI00396B25D8